MLTVETYVAPSEIAGIGLFADQDIEKGTVLWRFVPGFDCIFSLEEVELLPVEAQSYLKEYASLIPGLNKVLMCGDNDRFTNHSNDPNRLFVYKSEIDIIEIALRDIPRGTELTNDYSEFDLAFEEYADKLK